MKNSSSTSDLFDAMYEKWPSSVVSAPLVKQFSGGAITGKTLQNLSSMGQPVPHSIKIGGRRCFDAKDLAAWLRQRAEGRAA